MHFDLKRPCHDCPFLPGSSTNRSLKPERIEEIKRAVHQENKTFACHKTTHLPDEVNWQHCAGALIHLKKEGSHNDMIQLAERLGICDPHILDMTTEVID